MKHLLTTLSLIGLSLACSAAFGESPTDVVNRYTRSDPRDSRPYNAPDNNAYNTAIANQMGSGGASRGDFSGNLLGASSGTSDSSLSSSSSYGSTGSTIDPNQLANSFTTSSSSSGYTTGSTSTSGYGNTPGFSTYSSGSTAQATTSGYTPTGIFSPTGSTNTTTSTAPTPPPVSPMTAFYESLSDPQKKVVATQVAAEEKCAQEGTPGDPRCLTKAYDELSNYSGVAPQNSGGGINIGLLQALGGGSGGGASDIPAPAANQIPGGD